MQTNVFKIERLGQLVATKSKLLRKKRTAEIRESSHAAPHWSLFKQSPFQYIALKTIDFYLHFCHSPPVKAHAFGLSLPGQCREGRSDFL